MIDTHTHVASRRMFPANILQERQCNNKQNELVGHMSGRKRTRAKQGNSFTGRKSRNFVIEASALWLSDSDDKTKLPGSETSGCSDDGFNCHHFHFCLRDFFCLISSTSQLNSVCSQNLFQVNLIFKILPEMSSFLRDFIPEKCIFNTKFSPLNILEISFFLKFFDMTTLVPKFCL